MTPYTIIFTDQYERTAKRFLKMHPSLRTQYIKTLELLSLDPHHPLLRLHRLKGKLKQLHSVSINLSYRITIELIIRDKTIIPVMVGSHDKTYR